MVICVLRTIIGISFQRESISNMWLGH